MNLQRVIIYADKIRADPLSLNRNKKNLEAVNKNYCLGWYLGMDSIFIMHSIALTKTAASYGISEIYLNDDEFDFVDNTPLPGRIVRCIEEGEFVEGKLIAQHTGGFYAGCWEIRGPHFIHILKEKDFEVIE